MTEFWAFLSTQDSGLIIFLSVMFCLFIASALFSVYKVIFYILRYKKLKYKGLELNGSDKDNKDLNNLNNKKDLSLIKVFVNQIFELSHDRISEENELKQNTFADQRKFFSEERKNVFYKIKESYESKVKNCNLEDIILLEQWLSPLTQSTLEDVDDTLRRNHFKFMSEEEFEDAVENIFDSCYRNLHESVRNMPSYIKTGDYKVLEAAIFDNKAFIKDYFKSCFENARTLSIKLSKELEKINLKFEEKTNKLIDEFIK